MTIRIPLDELNSNQYDALHARAERTEAAIERVRALAHERAAISCFVQPKHILAALDEPGTAAPEPAHTASALRARLSDAINPVLGEYPEHNRTDEHEALLGDIVTAVLGVVASDIRR
ncbi:hypothetical protein [Streptomyces sp. NBC_00063]|uniref:hypothetical protein n=1 Tax=Streptomyces sp. NBC_00063 TaxID=2975638 RepID=UPI003D7292AF